MLGPFWTMNNSFFSSIIVFASSAVALFAAVKLFLLESSLILGALSVSHWLGRSHYHG
jgi:hypothetical protein